MPALGDYRQSYLDGLRALRRGAWEEAGRLLGAAARERPVEQARARLVGAIPEPYLPHHYLGLAHYHARRCPDALQEWDISRQQGAVQTLPSLFAEAERRRQDCESLAGAREEVAAAQAQAADLGSADLAATLRGDEALEGRHRESLAELAAAGERLRAGEEEWEFAPVAEAAQRAGAARAELAALAAEALRRQEKAVARAAGETPQGVEPEASAPGAAPGLQAAGGTTEPGEAAAGAAGESPEDHPEAGGTGSAAGGQSADPPAAPARPAAPASGPSPEPLGEPLVAAIQAYFDGDYQAALDRLAGAGPPASPRACFLAALFRAAARHALYLLGGEQDEALLAAAVADLGEARREQPDFAPQSDHFSPRFIAFFRGHP